MRAIRGRRAAFLLFAALFPLPVAVAASAQDTAERAIRLDQTIQALKDEVIELSREAQAVENAAIIPEHRRLSVYLKVAVSGLLLEEVGIAIDDQPAEVYHYDEFDARALQRVLRTSVEPGPHRIRMSVKGQYADAKPDDPPVTDSYEAIFDKSQRETELEFVVTRASRFGDELRLSMKEWRRRR
jgi:hypothetical protein